MTPNMRLTRVREQDNRLAATLRNEYTQGEEDRVVDHVVVERGTLPVDDLYFELRPRSVNLGEIDMDALIAGAPQTLDANPSGNFRLFRVGDAVASRSIHAAIYDSLRLCNTL